MSPCRGRGGGEECRVNRRKKETFARIRVTRCVRNDNRAPLQRYSQRQECKINERSSVSDSDAVSYRSPEFPASQHARECAQFVETRDKRVHLSLLVTRTGQTCRTMKAKTRRRVERTSLPPPVHVHVHTERERRATKRTQKEENGGKWETKNGAGSWKVTLRHIIFR